MVDTIREHLPVLVREGTRLKPDHCVREITDEISEVLDAVDSGTWLDGDVDGEDA